MARWSRTLSTLIASGVDIMRALEITAQTAGNWVVEEETAKLRHRVEEGASIAQPLIESEVFPPMIAQMVKIGEETGELEKMLSKVADFYEDEVDASIQALTSIIEPMMMVGVGVMVGDHHHQHVPADVQDAVARQVTRARAASRLTLDFLDSSGLLARWGPAEPGPLDVGVTVLRGRSPLGNRAFGPNDELLVAENQIGKTVSQPTRSFAISGMR